MLSNAFKKIFTIFEFSCFCEIDVLIKRVELKDRFEHFALDKVDIVHDRGQVCPGQDNDTVNIEHIAKKYRNRRKDKTHAEREQEQTDERIREHEVKSQIVQERGVFSALDQNDDIKRDKREKKVDPYKKTF